MVRVLLGESNVGKLTGCNRGECWVMLSHTKIVSGVLLCFKAFLKDHVIVPHIGSSCLVTKFKIWILWVLHLFSLQQSKIKIKGKYQYIYLVSVHIIKHWLVAWLVDDYW